MPCEDAPCCGCCPVTNEQDQREQAESYWEMQEALGSDIDDDYDESMDGDHDTAMASAGFGMDEDYGFAEDMLCEGYDEH